MLNRYAVFIDGGYFREVLNRLGKPAVSYLRLSEILGGREEVRLRTYYYDCPLFLSRSPTSEESRRQSRFERFRVAIEMEARFQVRLGRLAKFETSQGARFVQKKVDVLLALDLTRLAVGGQIQRAVLITGDSDFVPVIQVARDAGVVVDLCYSPSLPYNNELVQACDDRIIIDQASIDRIKP